MSPPKKPSDRDVLSKKNVPKEQDWTEDTGAHQIEAIGAERRDTTPIGLETLDAEANVRLRARVKETNQTVRALKETAATTQTQLHTGVDTLRLETERHVQRLDLRIGSVDKKVDKLDGKVDKLDTKQDEHTGIMLKAVGTLGKLDATVGELVKSNDERRHEHRVLQVARLEIDKEEKVAEIRDNADAAKKERELKTQQAKLRRDLMYRVLKWVGGVLAIVATAALTHFAEKC